MKNIKQATNKTKKELNGIDLPSIERYLKRQGYTVLYMGTADAEAEIRRFGLEAYAKEKTAFTFCGSAKFVFIRKDSHPATKQLLLLHELGHILLQHIGAGQSVYMETTECETEADAFAYFIIKHFRWKERYRALFSEVLSVKLLTCMVLFFFFGFLVGVGCAGKIFENGNEKRAVMSAHDQDASVEYTPTSTIFSEPATQPVSDSLPVEQTVYITPTGKCYHDITCNHKGNNYMPIDREIAEKEYRPCSFCNP